MPDGIHAQLAVRPPEDCPLGRVVADYPVRNLVPAQGETPPQVVVEDDADAVADDGALSVVDETKEAVICRLTPAAGDREEWVCEHCGERCPAEGFDHLPLRPYDLSVTGESLRLAFAAVDDDELRACMEELESLGRSVSLEALRADDDAEPDPEDPRTVLVDLSDLTGRQRETAALAVRQGYFESDGVSAAGLADQLDVSKSTVSEHLRAVRAKVGQQLFPEADGSDTGRPDDDDGDRDSGDDDGDARDVDS
jgi:DNA-binding CsgD family transcriptional regulator